MISLSNWSHAAQHPKPSVLLSDLFPLGLFLFLDLNLLFQPCSDGVFESFVLPIVRYPLQCVGFCVYLIRQLQISIVRGFCNDIHYVPFVQTLQTLKIFFMQYCGNVNLLCFRDQFSCFFFAFCQFIW